MFIEIKFCTLCRSLVTITSERHMALYLLLFFSLFSSLFSAAVPGVLPQPAQTTSAMPPKIAQWLHDAGGKVLDSLKSLGVTTLEELRAAAHLNVIFPGLQKDETLSMKEVNAYGLKRLKESGFVMASSLGLTIVTSLVFEALFKTNSRSRRKHYMVIGFVLAALYGTQLRQRTQTGFDTKTVFDRDIINRLFLLFVTSFCSVFGINLLLQWFAGRPIKKSAVVDPLKPVFSIGKQITWSFEVAFFNVCAAGLAFGLDSRH